MEVFLYLLDMHIDFQFILSSCGHIGNKCMVGVGLLLPRRTKSFVPVLYSRLECPWGMEPMAVSHDTQSLHTATIQTDDAIKMNCPITRIHAPREREGLKY